MEKRINQKLDIYIYDFKQKIIDKLDEMKKTEMNQTNDIDNLISIIHNYEPVILSKEDFVRRKRVKNVVPFYERCKALRANNERCTRRKKENFDFCGTHLKSQPHGVVNEDVEEVSYKKVIVHTEDIKGIIYYLDDNRNVYDPNDILNGVKNPKIIAKYTKADDNTYHIPEFNI